MICYLQKKIKIVNTLFYHNEKKYRKFPFSYTFNLSKLLKNKQQDTCNTLADVLQIKNA
jgi:hypothetical protein